MNKLRLSAIAVLMAGVAALPYLGHVTMAGGPESEEAPEAAEWRRFNERCSSDSLKTLSSAEPDFRANDEDWARVEDFWTADVRGLYTLPSAQERPE